VNPKGAKYWRYKYRYGGKEKTLALGVFPEVSLKDARVAHQEARAKLDKGLDPGEERRIEKLTRNLAAADSFESVALEWFDKIMPDKSES